MSEKDALILALQSRVAEQQLQIKDMAQSCVRVSFENNQLVIIGPFPESPLILKKNDYPDQWKCETNYYTTEWFSLSCTYWHSPIHAILRISSDGLLFLSFASERLPPIKHSLDVLRSQTSDIYDTLEHAMDTWAQDE